MNVFAKFDGIPLMILEVIKETKRYRHTFGQHENSIPSHKHSLGGGGGGVKVCDQQAENQYVYNLPHLLHYRTIYIFDWCQLYVNIILSWKKC